MKHLLSSLAFGALVLAAPTQAQTFFIGDELDHLRAERIEGSRPATISGVLLEENLTHFNIRVEGGVVVLPKSMVWKVERRGPSMAQLERQERDNARRLAAANERRRAVVAAEASHARSRRDFAAAEAAVLRAAATATPANAVFVAPTFDPVIGVADPGSIDWAQRAEELKKLYKQTRDASLRRPMREARRH